MKFRVTFTEKTNYEVIMEADSMEELLAALDDDDSILLDNDPQQYDSYIENIKVKDIDDEYYTNFI